MVEIKDKALFTELKYIRQLVAKGGPNPSDFQTLDAWHDRIWQIYGNDEKAIKAIRVALMEVYLNVETCFGLIFSAPHGYKGDFEIIDRIYQRQTTEHPSFKMWDVYYHHLSAVRAVRNRKQYFKNLLKDLNNQRPKAKVLNLASGPCRDLKEFFVGIPKSKLTFDCIELDKNAINYANKLLNNHPHIQFVNQNIFKFSTNEQYDLVWSAGLFDYFSDSIFVKILKRFLKNIKPNGELIIGNFNSDYNPTRSVMELVTWHLNHRTTEQLIALAKKAGITNEQQITIESEEEGVNLFMRIKVI